jgi:hypothetical protein
MKYVFDELIIRLDISKERSCEHEDMSIVTSQIEMQRENKIMKER